MKTWHTYNNNIVNLFCEKIDSKSAFLQQIWHILCLISMILMTTKYIENLHRDDPLSQYSIAKFFLLQAVHMNLKCSLNNFFWMTPYLVLIKIIQIRHNECHIYLKNPNQGSIFLCKKKLFIYCCLCIKFPFFRTIVILFAFFLHFYGTLFRCVLASV